MFIEDGRFKELNYSQVPVKDKERKSSKINVLHKLMSLCSIENYVYIIKITSNYYTNGRPLCPLAMSIGRPFDVHCVHCVHLPKWTQPTKTENCEWTQWTSILSIGHVHCVHPHVHWTCPMDKFCPLCPLDRIHKPTCIFTNLWATKVKADMFCYDHAEISYRMIKKV